MDTILGSVGFECEGKADYLPLSIQLMENAEVIPTSNGTYYCWSIPTKQDMGIELWTKKRLNGEYQIMKPHFRGNGLVKLQLEERLENLANDIYPGCFRTSFEQRILNCDLTLTVPFVFECPDFDRYAHLKLPKTAQLQMCGIAAELKGYETVEEFKAEHDQGSDVWDNTESLVPSDFSNRTARSETPLVFITGRVHHTELVTNPVTDKDFSWAVVSAPGFGRIDVVAHPQALEGYLVKGGLVDGTIGLSGHFHEQTLENS